ncbi:MAG TPA: TolC family protein [Longimicrobiales bacterium]
MRLTVRSRAAALAGALLAPACLPFAAARAQETPVTLTLEEAIALAREHNPAFLKQDNDAGPADWRVREAYSAWLPRANTGLGFRYEGGGPALVGSFTGSDLGLGATPAYYFSSYSIGMSLQLSAATLFGMGEARASREAVESRIDAAAFTLRADVTRQYIAVLRAQDGVTLARQQLESASQNLELAEARVRVGAAPPLEAMQAQVERGRAEVALVQAENLYDTERLRLMEQLGTDLDADVRLTTSFEVFEPSWTRDELVDEALAAHPQIESLRAEERARRAAVRSTRGSFLPTLRFSAGWSGFSRMVAADDQYLIDGAKSRAEARIESCETQNLISAGLSQPLPGYPLDCSQYALTQEGIDAVLADNRRFPFKFTEQPFSASLQISLPLFQGLSARRQLEEAQAAEADARYDLRAEELRRRTAVATALLDLKAAYRSAMLEEKNAATAAEQLRLARERYRLGVATFVELSQAETQKAEADRARLDAVYGFHEALAALEAAVGRRLRPDSGGQ